MLILKVKFIVLALPPYILQNKYVFAKNTSTYPMNGEYFAKHHVAITKIFSGIDVSDML